MEQAKKPIVIELKVLIIQKNIWKTNYYLKRNISQARYQAYYKAGLEVLKKIGVNR